MSFFHLAGANRRWCVQPAKARVVVTKFYMNCLSLFRTGRQKELIKRREFLGAVTESRAVCALQLVPWESSCACFACCLEAVWLLSVTQCVRPPSVFGARHFSSLFARGCPTSAMNWAPRCYARILQSSSLLSGHLRRPGTSVFRAHFCLLSIVPHPHNQHNSPRCCCI
jgi:hypothetical protein